MLAAAMRWLFSVLRYRGVGFRMNLFTVMIMPISPLCIDCRAVFFLYEDVLTIQHSLIVIHHYLLTNK